MNEVNEFTDGAGAGVRSSVGLAGPRSGAGQAESDLKLLGELADCYFCRRSEGLLELMRKASRRSPPNTRDQV